MTINWQEALMHASAAAIDAGSDEWAYFNLTSKMEDPIRNRIAFRLQQSLEAGGHDHVVARGGRTIHGDSRQFDIRAMTADGYPAMLAEAKLLYGFDALHNKARFLTNARSSHGADKLRLQDFAVSGTDCFLLSFLVHPMTDAVPQRIRSAMKYAKGHERVAKRVGYRELRRTAKSAWHDELRAFGEVTVASVKLGQAFGIPVELDLYTVGPLRS